MTHQRLLSVCTSHTSCSRPRRFSLAGVYLTGTVLTRARDLLELALHTPPIKLTPDAIDKQTEAYLRAKEYVTDEAAKLGLPVIAGYYGLNPNSGEILS